MSKTRKNPDLERKVAEIVTRLPPMPENIEKLLLHLPSASTSQTEIKRLT